MLRRSLSPVRCLVAALAVVLLALAAWLPQRAQNAPLRVAIGMWTGSESLLLARERGLLPASRFQWVEVTWPSALSSTLDNGVVDAAVMSLESVVTLLENGEDLRVIGIVDESRGADAVLARADIRSVSDLKGRRVGVDLRGPGQHLLSEALSSTGMSLQDVQMVSILQPEMVEVLARGDVAAVAAAEPWMTKMVADGAHILADSRAVKTPVYRVLVVRTPVLLEQREALQQLLRAHFTMVPVLRAAAPGAGMDAVLRRQELDAGQLAAIMARVHHPDLQENLRLMKDDARGFSTIISQLLALGRKDSTRPETGIPSQWLDSSILEEVSL